MESASLGRSRCIRYDGGWETVYWLDGEGALDDLYDDNGEHAGINWAAIIATAVGAVIGLINVDVSFFTATIPTGLVYYLCMKHMPSCCRFRKGTSLEK